MQKYFYRNVVFILLMLTSNILYGAITPNDNNVTIYVGKKLDKNSDFLKNLNKTSENSRIKYGTSIFKKNDTPKKKNKIKYKEYLVYFYSENMPFSTIKNLIPSFQKIKKIKRNMQIYIVFNGFPTKEFFLKLRKEYKDKYKNLFKIKIHPPMYSYFDLTEVPAYVLMSCPENFRFGKCKKDDSIIVRGDISLLDFYRVLSDSDKKYLDIYHKIIDIGM